MKKIIYTILLMISFTIVQAKNIEEEIMENGFYINSNGVTITEENYQKIINVLTDEEIENLSHDIYNEIEKGEELIDYTSILIETEYENIGGTNFVIANKVVNEEISSVMPLADQETLHTTSYKRIRMSITKLSGNNYSFFMSNYWSKLPETRSFDVFAMRWTNNTNISITDYNGTQGYKLNNTSYEIEYASTSNNFQTFNKGISLSQNLVDDSTYYFQTINTKVSCNSGDVTLYGTYQHALNTVTLAESKRFNLGAGGMGNVIIWSTSALSSTYDNTAGLSLSFAC